MRRVFLIGALLMSGVAGADQDPKILRLWKAKCASCHGVDGKAQTEQARKMGGIRDMTTDEWQKSWSDEKIRKVTLEGVKEGKKEMDGYKDLKPEQLDGLVKFMRALKK